MKKKYELRVRREILITVSVEAESPEEALQRYQDGDFVGEEDVLDSSDIAEPSVKELLDDDDDEEFFVRPGDCIYKSKTCKMPIVK